MRKIIKNSKLFIIIFFVFTLLTILYLFNTYSGFSVGAPRPPRKGGKRKGKGTKVHPVGGAPQRANQSLGGDEQLRRPETVSVAPQRDNRSLGDARAAQPQTAQVSNAPVRSTGRSPVPRQQSRRTPTLFTKAIRDYIDSLPRGEKQYAENTIRLYMTGPAQLDAAEALERFMERRGRDAQAPSSVRRQSTNNVGFTVPTGDTSQVISTEGQFNPFKAFAQCFKRGGCQVEQIEQIETPQNQAFIQARAKGAEAASQLLAPLNTNNAIKRNKRIEKQNESKGKAKATQKQKQEQQESR